MFVKVEQFIDSVKPKKADIINESAPPVGFEWICAKNSVFDPPHDQVGIGRSDLRTHGCTMNLKKVLVSEEEEVVF